MIHLCKMPYELNKVNKNLNNFKDVDERLKNCNEDDEEYSEDYLLGSTGCGICSLKKLKDIGVTHLKVVGRGNFIDNMEKDVSNLRKAINMINECNDNLSFEKKIKKDFFNENCSGECYYVK